MVTQPQRLRLPGSSVSPATSSFRSAALASPALCLGPLNLLLPLQHVLSPAFSRSLPSSTHSLSKCHLSTGLPRPPNVKERFHLVTACARAPAASRPVCLFTNSSGSGAWVPAPVLQRPGSVRHMLKTGARPQAGAQSGLSSM